MLIRVQKKRYGGGLRPASLRLSSYEADVAPLREATSCNAHASLMLLSIAEVPHRRRRFCYRMFTEPENPGLKLSFV
jgi:hypothetical protein